MRAIAATIAIALAAAPRPSQACSCGRQAPCEAYWEADVVFVGTVTSHKSSKFHVETINGKKVTVIDETTTATLDVVEQFRGSVGKTVTVETEGCGVVAWQTGVKFLVYAARDGARLVSHGCSRTDRVADADADLAYAHSQPEKAALGFVQGVVTSTAANDTGMTRPVANALVKVRGLAKAVTQTTARGAFKIMVPPGDHVLEIIAPGLRVDGEPPTAKVAARGACAIVEPTLIASGVARGRLVDHDGKPAARIPVVASNSAQAWTRSAVTDRDGRFEIRDVPAKQQFVLSAASSGPTVELPYPPRFYPAAATEHAAKVITLPASGVADKLDFALPPGLVVIETTGSVTRRKRPVAEASVTATVNGSRRQVDTDKLGRFKVRHFTGEVIIEACAPRFRCRHVKRTLQAAGTVDIALP